MIQTNKQTEFELYGGYNNYYLANIKYPSRIEHDPYIAECDDIIKTLNMTFMEGCIFKEIWRTANARLGNGKKNHTQEYGYQKIKHYAKIL